MDLIYNPNSILKIQFENFWFRINFNILHNLQLVAAWFHLWEFTAKNIYLRYETTFWPTLDMAHLQVLFLLDLECDYLRIGIFLFIISHKLWVGAAINFTFSKWVRVVKYKKIQLIGYVYKRRMKYWLRRQSLINNIISTLKRTCTMATMGNTSPNIRLFIHTGKTIFMLIHVPFYFSYPIHIHLCH